MFDSGKIRTVKPIAEPKHVKFKKGFSTKTYRFDTPDQLTLPMLSTVKNVSSRIAYDDKHTVGFLSFMFRSGFWRIINRPMFKGLRHSLLYNPGEGGSHEFLLALRGKGTDGLHKHVRASLLDDEGQTHMTALGGVIQVERALTLRGNTQIDPGITFSECHENVDIALTTLQEHGIKISIES